MVVGFTWTVGALCKSATSGLLSPCHVLADWLPTLMPSFCDSFTLGYSPSRLGEPTYRDDSGSGFGGDGSPYDGSFFAEPWEMLRHFEDVFRNFGLAEFPHGESRERKPLRQNRR